MCSSGSSDMYPIMYRDAPDLPCVPESQYTLINTVAANARGPLAHGGWARLPTWLKTTLGDNWSIQSQLVTVGKAVAQAVWYISDANSPSNPPVRVSTSVFTVMTNDGQLDIEGSAEIVRQHVGDVVVSVQRVDSWVLKNLSEFGETLQYAGNIGAGRVVLVAGNIVMDISGLSSSEALLPHAAKLFNQTARRDNSPVAVPVLQLRREINVNVNNGDAANLAQTLEDGTVQITGIHTRFSIIFNASCKLAVAKGGCDGGGILFDRYHAQDDGHGSDVEFFFITHKAGRHHVRVSVADLETMASTFHDLEIEVVDVEK